MLEQYVSTFGFTTSVFFFFLGKLLFNLVSVFFFWSRYAFRVVIVFEVASGGK